MLVYTTGGDQGILNAYWSEWATKDIKYHLPFIYNVTPNMYYQYAPAYKRYLYYGLNLNCYINCVGAKVKTFNGYVYYNHILFDICMYTLLGLVKMLALFISLDP